MSLTKIEWATYTFNPWEGCQAVSPGCKHCYAEDRDIRWHKGSHWGPESARMMHNEAYWRQPLKWDREASAAGRIDKVFCGSLCDILERREELDQPRTRVFDLVPQTPSLMWLFLTKRPENALDLFPEAWLKQWPANAMFGFTAENQQYLNIRMRQWSELVRRIRGLRTFISIEPLLGPINFEEAAPGYGRNFWDWSLFVDWVICGGESGAKARPMHPDWARSVRDQVQQVGIPFLFKQWGAWIPAMRSNCFVPLDGICHSVDGYTNRYGTLTAEGGAQTDRGWASMERVDKKEAGRLLDGREWNEQPGDDLNA